MLGITELINFILAFFLVMPLVSLIHEAGHAVCALLMGAKNMKLTIGTGDHLFTVGKVEIKKYYFWYGYCRYDELKYNTLFSHILIFSGGFLFNGLTALLVSYFIRSHIISETIVLHQFVYFSFYYIFFSLLPIPFPDGTYSDGKVIIDLIKDKQWDSETIIHVRWDSSRNGWIISNQEEIFQSKEAAIGTAVTEANKNKPSRVYVFEKDKQKVFVYMKHPPL